ncbi:MAG: hypothetical protein ACKOUR_11525 [Planctomycetota bacterium]
MTNFVLHGQFVPGEAVGQVPDGSLSGITRKFTATEHAAEFNDVGLFREGFDWYEFVLHAGTRLGATMFEADGVELDLADLFRADVEHATHAAHATTAHASHTTHSATHTATHAAAKATTHALTASHASHTTTAHATHSAHTTHSTHATHATAHADHLAEDRPSSDGVGHFDGERFFGLIGDENVATAGIFGDEFHFDIAFGHGVEEFDLFGFYVLGFVASFGGGVGRFGGGRGACGGFGGEDRIGYRDAAKNQSTDGDPDAG